MGTSEIIRLVIETVVVVLTWFISRWRNRVVTTNVLTKVSNNGNHLPGALEAARALKLKV